MIVYDQNAYYAYVRIEQQRARLLRSKATVQQQDYGSGARERAKGAPQVITRTVGEVARTHLESPQVGQLLFRLVNYLTEAQGRPLTIVELGTSLGITTAYLAAPDGRNVVQTYEGAEEVADEAREVWQALRLTNIQSLIGNIDDTLVGSCPKPVDIAYIDANHTREATLRYFKQLLPAARAHSIFILDDIHHSPEMEQAWHEIRAMKQVTSTIDCYHLGLVFFDPHYMRKNYRIRL